MATAATRRRPRGRTLARLVTALAMLGSARPTSAQDANATNTTNATASIAPPPPAQPSPPPAEATVAPPPPPARPSMDELKAAATRRVLDIPRFVKTQDECPEALLAPPSVLAAADRRFLLPPGRTWGPLSFEPAAVTDEDFTREDVPEPERYLEELIVDFALVAAPDASNRSSADLRLMVPARAEETGADADGGEAVTDTTQLVVAAKSYIRVLPARSGSPSEVDATTTPYLAIDRLLAAFEDDAIATTADAASVAAILTPDAPGTYVVLITAVDACNATSHAFVNVTALCSHVPRPAVASASAGASRWDQRAAAAHADDAHPLGWWAPRALDGSGTAAVDASEGDYRAHKVWVDAEIWGRGDAAALAVATAPAAWDAATPLRSSPFSSWTWWNAAPAWTAGANEEDGFLYRWTMTGAPRGSNAWRRVLRRDDAIGDDDDERSAATASGATEILHASAPDTGETPFVDDAATATATFAPDVVGTYAFRLDVSNVCHAASVAFEASFECNAEPRWVEASVRASADEKGHPGCLAGRTVYARVEDDDGDDVFVTWSHAAGREGWPEEGAAETGAAAEDAVPGADADGATTTTNANATNANATNANATNADANANANATNADANANANATAVDVSSAAAAAPAPISAGASYARVVARTFADGITFTGARSASGGAVLSSYVGNMTSFQPDVPGTYALLATLTDGCTATRAEVFVEVAWSEKCDALAAAAAETSTAVTVLLFALAVALVLFASRHVAAHPLDPRATRDVAARLREWERRKAAVKHARLRERWEADLDARGDAESGSRLMGEDERERAAAARRRRRAARARARVARRVAAAVAACAGAREESSRLVPATTHLWRLACFVGVFAEGVSLSSLAFAANTAPWWGRTVASVGRALAFQLDAPGAYVARDALAACVAVAAAAALFHAAYHARDGTSATRDATERTGNGSVSRGDDAKEENDFGEKNREKNESGESASSSFVTGFVRLPRVSLTRAAHTKAKPVTNAMNDESLETMSVAFANTARGFALAAFAATTPFLVWLVAEPLLVPTVASFAAMVTCTHGDAHAPFPHLTRDDDAPCYETSEAAYRALSAVVVAGVAAPAVAAYFALRVSPRLDPLAVEQPWHALVRLAAKWFLAAFCVLHGEGDMTRHEPRGGDYGVPSGAHLGYPADRHAARDRAHLAALAGCVALLYALNFRAAPVRGAGTSRRVNAARGACFACAFWVATLAFFVTTRASAPAGAGGAAGVERETAAAAAALLFLPAFFLAGWRHTAARAALFAYPDLTPAEMRRAPDPRVRAMGVLAGDATDGMCGAFGNWEGLRAHRAATTARKMARGVDYSAASEALGVDRTPGSGLSGLTDEGRDDAADDALVWQIVMQTYFAAGGSGRYGVSNAARVSSDAKAASGGKPFRRFRRNRGAGGGEGRNPKPGGPSAESARAFTVDPSVRAHFCDAVSALASSPRGVATAQKCCLVPLLRRVLLDDSPANAPARARAAEAFRALAQSRRGAALLCLSDDDSFMTCWYHRHRDWFRILIHLEARYGRAAADLARASYLLGFGAARADAATKSERGRFDALIDWNVRRWLDDGERGLSTTNGGGDDDDGRGFGDRERLSVSAYAKRARVFFVDSLLRVAAPELSLRMRIRRRARAAARLAAIRAERHARGDVSTSECLARVVRDADAEMAVVISAIRAAGDWLASLRAARGAPDPRCAERRLRDAARRDAGSLFRVGGLFGYRDLFESWTLVDDDDFLAQTVPGARVMVTKAEFLALRQRNGGATDGKREDGKKGRFSVSFESFAEFKERAAESLATVTEAFARVTRPVLETVFGIVKRRDGGDESDSEGDEDDEDDESDGMLSVSAEADSDADRDASVTDSVVSRDDELAVFRVYDERRVSGDAPDETRVRVRPSPMDKALDAGRENHGAPGLLESLVACTAHPNARVRTAAHEELRRAAAGDEAATVARRALAYSVTVDSSVDATGRVRALEWLNALVVARLRVLSNVAADVAEAREREARRLASVARDGLGRTGSTEDYAMLHPGLSAARSLSRAVDLSLAVGVAEDATPCVDAVLSRAGVATVARCLEDRESSAVRVAAIRALRDAWETLAAAEPKTDGSYDAEGADSRSSYAPTAITGMTPSLTRAETDATDATYETSVPGTGVPDASVPEEGKEKGEAFGFSSAREPISTRARRFLAAGAFAKLRGAAEADPDAVVRRAADAFLTDVAQTEGAAVLELELERASGDDERAAWSDAPFVEYVRSEDDGDVEGDVEDAEDAPNDDDDEDDEDDEDEGASGSGAKSVAGTGADDFATTTGYETSRETELSSGSERNLLETSSRRGGAAPSTSRGSESESGSESPLSSERSAATSASSWRFGRAGEEGRFLRENAAGEDGDGGPAGGPADLFAKGPGGYRATNRAGAKRWDAYVRENAPPTVRYARSKPTAEKNARRPLSPADTSGRAAGDLSRWSRFVAREAPAEVARARRAENEAENEAEAEAAEEGEAARERRERRARGARRVRARAPLRAAPLAGTALAPTRARLGELAGPGPAAPVVRDPDRPLAPVDPNRPTWRERAAEYILAGGGAGGAGGARRGPHERALLRDGRVGLAGRRRESRHGLGGGVGVAPHDLFPPEGTNDGRAMVGASTYSFDAGGVRGAARYRARSRYGGSVSGGSPGGTRSRGKAGAKTNRRGLRDDPSGAGLVYRQDSRLHDFDGFDFDALDAARAAAASAFAETDSSATRSGDGFPDFGHPSRDDDERALR